MLGVGGAAGNGLFLDGHDNNSDTGHQVWEGLPVSVPGTKLST